MACRTNPVCPLFVFLHLLERQAKGVSEVRLAHIEHHPAHAHPTAHMLIDRVRRLLAHNSVLEASRSRQHHVRWLVLCDELFVEHCEAVAAEVDVTRRWLGEQGRRGLSFSSDVLPERHGVPEVACEPSVGRSLLLLPA